VNGDRRSTCSLRLAIRNAWLLFYLCDCVVPRSVKSRGSRLRYSGWRRFSDPWNRRLIIASRTHRPRNICTYIRISRSEHVKINEYSHMCTAYVHTGFLFLSPSLSFFRGVDRVSAVINLWLIYVQKPFATLSRVKRTSRYLILILLLSEITIVARNTIWSSMEGHPL